MALMPNFRRAVLGIICIEIAGSSIFFGAVHIWAWSVLVALSCLVWVLFLCDMTFLHNKTQRSIPRLLLALLVLFVFSLSLQLLIPLTVKVPVTPKLTAAFNYFEVSRTIPSLFSHYQAKLALYRWIIPLTAFTLMPYALCSKNDLLIILTTIVAVASLQGIYGVIQYLGKDPFAFFVRYDKQYPVSGTYICRNTYACYMAMGATIAVGLISKLLHSHRKIPPGIIARINQLVQNPRLPWITLILLGMLSMALGTFFSLSRAGVILLISGVSLFTILYFLHRPHKRALTGLIIGAVLLIGPLATYLYLLGINPLLTRFAMVSLQGEQSRWQLSVAATKVFQRHWLLGCGGGCYGYTLEIYKPPKFRPYLYAHNDYLQFLAEYGIITFLCSLLVLIAWLYIIFNANRYINLLFSPALWCCCASALCILLAHATIDFSLHIPGHRLTGAVLMGCMMAMSQTQKSPTATKEKHAKKVEGYFQKFFQTMR